MFNNKKYIITKELDPTKPIEIVETPKPAMMKLDKDYVKPMEGTYQQNMSKLDILKKIEGYTKLSTIEEKAVLKDLVLFKTYVRYYDNIKKEFRLGGALIKVEYPKYIMLMNLTSKVTWSVQLQNNTIFIPDKKILKKVEVPIEQTYEEKQKEKLWSLYKQGKLTKK